MVEKPRTQTSCVECRRRKGKCDLKDKRAEAERSAGGVDEERMERLEAEVERLRETMKRTVDTTVKTHTRQNALEKRQDRDRDRLRVVEKETRVSRGVYAEQRKRADSLERRLELLQDLMDEQKGQKKVRGRIRDLDPNAIGAMELDDAEDDADQSYDEEDSEHERIVESLIPDHLQEDDWDIHGDESADGYSTDSEMEDVQTELRRLSPAEFRRGPVTIGVYGLPAVPPPSLEEEMDGEDEEGDGEAEWEEPEEGGDKGEGSEGGEGSPEL